MDTELHRVAVTAIIYRPDRTYLITRRSLEKQPFPGRWNVPGGGLSTDDYVHGPPTHGDHEWYRVLERALRREVREEVGVEIGAPEFLTDLAFLHPKGFPVLVLSYFAPYVSGTIAYDEDTIDSRWVTVGEAQEYTLIGDTLGEIRAVDAILAARRVL